MCAPIPDAMPLSLPLRLANDLAPSLPLFDEAGYGGVGLLSNVASKKDSKRRQIRLSPRPTPRPPDLKTSRLY